MGLREQSQADGAQAIEIFAELSGMDPEAGNTLLPGHTDPIVGLYGATRVSYVKVEGGGSRKITEVVLSIAREALEAPPPENSKVVRTDLKITYTVSKVDKQDPVFWLLTLRSYAA